MAHDQNQPESSYYGQHLPPLSQRPPSSHGLPQQAPLSESSPQWGQQPLPQDRQPPGEQSQNAGSPLPTSWPPQLPKKRSSRRLLVTLALVGGLLALACIGSAIFVAQRISSPARLPRSVTPPTGSARLAGPVTNLNDNGPGSLRYAVDVTPAGGTITFDPSLRGTILLTSGDLNIAKSLTIRGPGAGILSISGGKSGHIVRVRGFSVTISGLTFKDSNTSDGFIFNQGMLTLSNSIVSGNTGTGTYSAGGIFNQGTLTLNNSTVSGNTATFDGGGIFNQGMLTLNKSTVSGNTATSDGGGIDNNGGTLTLNNSIVSGNKPTDIFPSP